ncbi:hypothetical protein [Skermanella pratensis]|uniref:hypothetical protein n=1 Tax=Skermanella pratensis TaxID=2233999 RepID=UPI001301100A|nr:hypothetical protein [Skermanella pratensis]
MTTRRDRAPPGGSPGSPSGERLVALFLLALVLFNPPLLKAFGAPGSFFGWPALLVYIFGTWALVIVLLGLAMERRHRDEDNR